MIFVNRSIPLSRESRDAWTSAGAVVLSRNPRRRANQLAACPQAERVVINLGITEAVDAAAVYNSRDSVRSVLTPAALRRTLPDLIPPEPDGEVMAWLKGPGQRGENKHHVMFNGEGLEPGWDWQLHVAGTEFRVISVGNLVVQAHRRDNIEWINERHVADWHWVGVKGVSQNGIIPVVKQAVAQIPAGDRTVIGWDFIVGDRPYIIEANSSPGMSEATARRIINAIH